MTDREKLDDLLKGFSFPVTVNGEPLSQWMIPMPQIRRALADHLLANGVTFATDTPVADKLSPTEPLTICQQWIPVTERLPKKQGFYLVAHQRSGYVAERFYYQDCPDLFVKTTGDPVTHWMPLPESPEPTGGDAE